MSLYPPSYDPDSSFENENVETIPDEEFEKTVKQREKLISWPNSENKKGPNINWKFQKKRYSNEQEKNYFFEKIKKKKKTELCKNFELYHDCFYKNECSFAHGLEELRQATSQPKYKTKICKSFQENLICNFGIRCNYLHIIQTKRLFTYGYILQKESQEIMTELEKKDNSKSSFDLIFKTLLSNKKLVL